MDFARVLLVLSEKTDADIIETIVLRVLLHSNDFPKQAVIEYDGPFFDLLADLQGPYVQMHP